MHKASWKIFPRDEGAEKKAAQALSVSGITAGILLNRGLKEQSEFEDFLSPSPERMHDPFLLKDMEKAVALIHEAIKTGKKILVYGDYDADGITSTALIVDGLRRNGASVDFFIPHRINEGYGLNETAIKRARENGCELIITVDCGITALEEIIFARRLGFEIIVTDHHEAAALALPPADAIINPKQFGCEYPCKKLSGAGVALKLIWALFGKEQAIKDIDLAAIGTVADVCPLTDENRIIVKFGIEALSNTTKPGLLSLMESAGVSSQTLTARDIAFMLAPRLNAPGRIDSADSSVDLLLCGDLPGARDRAGKLERDNRLRQGIQKKILKSALEKIGKTANDPMIALFDNEWHPGLIGIIASKISEKYARPAVLIGNMGRGSARSWGDFHILSALKEYAGMLADLGGHAGAAGFSIKENNIPKFLEKIRKIAPGNENGDPGEQFVADRKISLSEVSTRLLEEIETLRPFGEGNPEPLFVSENVDFLQIRCLKNRHLKMKAVQNGAAFDCIGFGMYNDAITANPRGEILFTPGINHWNGKRTIQFVLKDIHTSRHD